MKKHEFMTRLANELHSPSSVCSASLRSQLPLIGEALGMRGSKASLVRGSRKYSATPWGAKVERVNLTKLLELKGNL